MVPLANTPINVNKCDLGNIRNDCFLHLYVEQKTYKHKKRDKALLYPVVLFYLK